MKLGSHEISNKWIIIGSVILVGIIIFVYISIPNSKPPNPIPLINDAQIQLQKQYEAQLKSKDSTIRDYQSRLTVSQEKYSTLTNRYIQLQKEKENVKPPVTNAETRDRFAILGFTPLPIK